MNILASLLKLGQRRFVVLALAAGIAASGTMVWTASTAAFTGYTTNPGNTWTAATVTLTDDDTGADKDSGTAMFTLANLVPGETDYRCIKVTYTGSTVAAANRPKVRLYASASTSGTWNAGADKLSDKLNIKIEESATDTGTGVFSGTVNTTCNDAVEWVVAGSRILYDSAVPAAGDLGQVTDLRADHASWANGLPQAAEWEPTNNQYRLYKVTYTLDASTPDDAQGLDCTLALRWEAQSV